MILVPVFSELLKVRILWLMPLFCLFIAVQGQAHASAHRVTKMMDLTQMDYATAREMAIKQAIQSVLLQHGGRVDATIEVVDGVVRNKHLIIAHQGVLRAANVLTETRQEQQLHLDIEVIINDVTQQCHAIPGSIDIVTSDMPFLAIQDAQDNQLHDLSQYLPKRLAHMIKQQGSALRIAKIAPEPWYQALKQNPKDSIMLGLTHNASYILVGQIDDAATSRRFPSEYAFWQKPTAQRNLALRFHVYDTFTGEQVFNRGYQFTAQWPFAFDEIVNVHTRAFAESQYAQHIYTLLLQVQQDIASDLTCRIKRGRIVGIDKQQLIINLGENQGINPATKFALIQQKQHLSGVGSNIVLSQPTETYFNIVYTQPDVSVIQAEDTFLSHNIQTNDWVVVVE